jgi:pimeloyl-ACP methyl ester carboxylesterase
MFAVDTVSRSSWMLLPLWALSACDRAPRAEPPSEVQPVPAAAAPRRPDPIRVEPLDAREVPPVFVLRGEPRGQAKLVFLHGMCGHGLGYAQSFQFSAAAKGRLIAPQGDVVCGKGPWALWSADLVALDGRITAAFRALGEADPIDDIVAMGYSQGATRAEALARRWPERYTRLILIGAPKTTSARGLSALRAAVMMAGERDRQDQMKAGARALESAGVPATFIEIPEASHGAMGPAPEQTMGAALDWLFSRSRPR